MSRGPSGQRYDGRRSVLGLALGASLIMMGAIAAGVVAMDAQTLKEYGGEGAAFSAGDLLYYHVEGVRDGKPFNGTMHFNVTNYSYEQGQLSYGVGYDDELADWSEVALGSNMISFYGQPIGGHWIHTAFGEKFTARSISYENSPEFNTTNFCVGYTGVESQITYRVNISGVDYHACIELMDTTVVGMDAWDEKEWAIRLDPYQPTGLATYHNPDPAGVMYQLWSIHYEGELNLSGEGNGSVIYIFNDSNMRNMESGGYLEFDEGISLPTGEGTRRAMIQPGHYFLVFDSENAVGPSRMVYEVLYR
jgi:hypothetical protein